MRKIIMAAGAIGLLLCLPTARAAVAADAEVRYLITNGGVDVMGNGEVHLSHAGHRDQGVTWARSGGAMRIPEGQYDVHITFSDGAAAKDLWIDNQAFAGTVEKTVEIGIPIAELRYVITNGGVDVKDNGEVHLSHAGHRDQGVTWARSGGAMRIAEGNYDVHVTFADGAAAKDIWIDNQAVAGKVEKTVEIGMVLTNVRYVITNGGVDVKDNGEVHLSHAGHHDQGVTWARSGGSMRVPEGHYDVHVTFSDGAAAKDVWINDQAFSGTVEKTVEVGVVLTDVRYVITNGDEDVKDKGEVHLSRAGHRDQGVTWARSGGTMRIPDGPYDVHVTFADGMAHKDMWIENQAFSGKVEKTVEIGLPVADVRYVVTNNGADVTDKGQIHYALAGHHDQEVTWARSGDTLRLAAGAYDVRATYDDGLIHKRVWVDNQAFSGKIDRAVELALKIAEPTVSVTKDGADVGDQATVGFSDPVRHQEIGAVRSGQPAVLEAGTYDIRASLFGTEGWLRAAALAGKQHLTINLKPIKTEQLQANGPPPKACVIEVYGVNFDFDKSTLRTESEPVLKQVLSLFTRTPGFAAEVGGHTDNVGKPDYNLKLSDARAAVVKAWLTAHGVAAARVASHGYGDTRPLLPNTTDENRFKNRRVELRTAECR